MGTKRKVVSFLIVGFATTVLGFLLLYVFIEWQGLDKNTANLTQLLIVLQVNFFFNTKFTWRDVPTTKKGWFYKWTGFHLVHLVGFVTNLAVYAGLVVWLHYIVASAIAIALVTVLNYLGMDKIVFKRR